MAIGIGGAVKIAFPIVNTRALASPTMALPGADYFGPRYYGNRYYGARYFG